MTEATDPDGPSWDALFDAAAPYGTTIEEIRAALAERREGKK